MQLGIPRVVQLRMLLNVVIDAVVGAVPLFGDAFDVAWKANDWNMRLLERHAWEERPPSRGDWLFVTAIAGAMLAVIAIPIVTSGSCCGGWHGAAPDAAVMARVFLLSPANASGVRAQQLLSPHAGFELARRAQSRTGPRSATCSPSSAACTSAGS